MPSAYQGQALGRWGLYSVLYCNNVYIFPAMGLGVVASGARRVTDPTLLAAARALAGSSPALEDASAPLRPPLSDIRRVAAQIAFAVGMEAQKWDLAPKLGEDELRRRVIATQWTPAYLTLGCQAQRKA